MAQKRIQYVKTQSGLEKQLFSSSADIVEIEAVSGMKATNVQEAIEELQDIAAQGGVTSVNGKTGAVTLAKSDIGLGNADNTSDKDKPVSTAMQTELDKKANTADLGALATKDSLTNTDVGLGNVTNDAQVKRSEMGAANGVATLDTTGKVPAAQLPSYVDDVLNYANKAGFPSSGETGKIYVAEDTNKTYRWSGTAYVEISESLALGETASTAYAGDKGKQNADAIDDIGELLDGIQSGDIKIGASEKADKLSTPRIITVSGDTSGSVAFDGSKDVTIQVELATSGVTAGAYSVVQVDEKGRVTKGNQLVEWGTSGQKSPSSDLAIGGIFFELVG